MGLQSFHLMKLLLLSTLISIATPLQAVEQLPLVEAADEDLIYLSDGQVIFKDQMETASLQRRYSKSLMTQLSTYEPTVLSDQTLAHRLYELMRTDYLEEAQCTNMAHIWAYEEFKRSGLKSQKIFLFFTKKYIMRYRFGWWFHVSPLVQIKENNQTLNVVLDRRYTSIPLDIKTWTDHFVKSSRTCKEIDRISIFWNNQQSEDCYLMLESMYYWQPRDIRLRDENGKQKAKFINSEINYSYQQAFKNKP